MRLSTLLFVLSTTLLISLATAAEEPLIRLRVLYIGAAKTPRAAEFDKFLKRHFSQVTLADREGFNPAAAKDADVVLFDWSQSEGDLPKTIIPMGKCDEWSKPTVLLNHAGLLVAGQWQLIGGAG